MKNPFISRTTSMTTEISDGRTVPAPLTAFGSVVCLQRAGRGALRADDVSQTSPSWSISRPNALRHYVGASSISRQTTQFPAVLCPLFRALF